MLPLAAEYGVKILPADSEHSAIFQCMQGLPVGGLRRIILTASGGAFRDWPVEKLKEVRRRCVWGVGLSGSTGEGETAGNGDQQCQQQAGQLPAAVDWLVSRWIDITGE